MWIRTQDRERLTNCNEITFTDYKNKNNIVGDLGQTLGTYATKERAMQVLDEIEKHIIGRLIIPVGNIPNEEHWIYKNNYAILPNKKDEIQVLPTIYQMPKE